MISRNSIRSFSKFGCVLLLAIATISSTGCLGGLGLNATALPTDPNPQESLGRYQVDMVGAFDKSASFQGEIDGPITVQDALERSRATKKFRNMDIAVYRTVEESGRVLKMEVEYVPRTKSVKPEKNYALHANDRIVVESRTNTTIDRIIDSLNPTK